MWAAFETRSDPALCYLGHMATYKAYNHICLCSFPIVEKDIHIKLITVSGSSYIHLTCKVFNHVQIHAHVGVRSVNKAHKLHQNVWRTYHCKRLQSANHLTQGPVNAHNLLNAHYIKLHQRVTFVRNLHLFFVVLILACSRVSAFIASPTWLESAKVGLAKSALVGFGPCCCFNLRVFFFWFFSHCSLSVLFGLRR